MKAFDAFLDGRSFDKGLDAKFDANNKKGLDKSLDSKTSRLLSRDFNTSINGFRPRQLPESQQLTVASNYFALACPIMPVGLLGAFMLLAGLDNMNHRQPHMTKADEVARENQEAAQQIYLLAMKEKKEREAKKPSSLSCSRPVDLIAPKAGDKQRKPKEVSLQPQGKISERVNGPSLLSKQKNDASKLVKQKMALESHLDKLSQEQDYAMHSRLSSQLDLLDKALKKLGA
jgi:hypothetical protein